LPILTHLSSIKLLRVKLCRVIIKPPAGANAAPGWVPIHKNPMANI